MSVYYNPDPLEITEMINAARKQLEYLSGIRQRMGIEMMEDGKTQKVIAETFGVSVTTVGKWRPYDQCEYKRDWLRGKCSKEKKHYLRPINFVEDA